MSRRVRTRANRTGMILGLLLLLPIFAWGNSGANGRDMSQKVGGTIPVIRKLFVSDGGQTRLFSKITVEDYLAGFKKAEAASTALTVLSNAPWKITVKGEFAPMGAYVKPARDLVLKIKDKTFLNESGTGGVFHPTFIDFSPLDAEEQVIWMDTQGGDHVSASIDYKVLLSTARDIPGEYNVTITYTISEP